MSVILPIFNGKRSVARAIESVLGQTYSRVELLIVDDGSTDATPAIVERYRSRAIILRQENLGCYAARNHALNRAAGELVAFIDSDDAWLSDKLERQVPLMRSGVGVVYGDITIVTAPDDAAPRTGRTGFSIVTPHRGHVLERFVRGNFVPTCTALVRRSALTAIGGFAEESRLSADYLAWFKIARHHQFDYVDAPVALYTRHDEGISQDLGRSLAARIDLFRAERERSRDAAEREILDRLLFNLSVQLRLAAARGRARTVEHPWRLARAAAAMISRHQAFWSLAGFAANELRTRVGRLWR